MEESQDTEFGLDRRNEDMRSGACQDPRDIEYALCGYVYARGLPGIAFRMKGLGGSDNSHRDNQQFRA